jgi:hypothetical protein
MVDPLNFDPHNFAIEAYLKELSDLAKQRQRIERRIQKIEKVVRGMIDLIDDESKQIAYMEKLDDLRPPAGLSEAIQQVLQSEERAFFPTEIRGRIEDFLRKYSNKMAPVHTTLKRLCKQPWSFVEAVEKDGKTAYQSSMFRLRKEADAQAALAAARGEKHWP